ncbi:MAG: triose-phosphate isomerase [Legionellales bacterium]|jgi:triosephosphate isomerase
MLKALLVANWKMNGSLDLLTQMQQTLLAKSYSKVDIAICPPFILLPQTQDLFKDSQIAYGAQDVSNEDNGAFTGQISAKMLSQLACEYVIIGHSERRAYCGETDALIAAKCKRALDANLIPILCVGENAQQKQRGETAAIVLSQVNAVVKSLTADELERLVIAYEPIWAIGTGLAANPQDANKVHELIRNNSSQTTRILYGGSANAENIREFLMQPHIDGALIGGAALKPDVFLNMIQTANEINK